MKARRMAYWWFRFVVSGRFLEKFLKAASPLIRRRDDGRILAHPLSPTISHSGRCRGARNVALRAEAWTRAPNGSESGERTRLKSINKVNAATVKMRG